MLIKGIDSGGAEKKISVDSSGRLATNSFLMRGSAVTATASVTTGTPTTLLAGQTGNFLDLVYISLSNSSDAAVNVILSDDALTVRTYTVPVATTNGGLVTFDYPFPVSQGAKGSDWKLDMADITGTTVTVDAQFIKN
jgi:hypothetical protein